MTNTVRDWLVVRKITIKLFLNHFIQTNENGCETEYNDQEEEITTFEGTVGCGKEILRRLDNNRQTVILKERKHSIQFQKTLQVTTGRVIQSDKDGSKAGNVIIRRNQLSKEKKLIVFRQFLRKLSINNWGEMVGRRKVEGIRQ